jgi:sugar lactone lactonase YvrE
VAFGPDRALYVAETLSGHVLRYATDDGRLGRARVFARLVQPDERRPGVLIGPDGLAFDRDGHLLAAVLGRGDVTVIGRSGRMLGHIPLPGSFPTNLAFGLPRSLTVLITEGSRGELLQIPWPVDGLALHRPCQR